MKTKFYKILNKDKVVIYIGITTRSIEERFKEHIKTKNLNPTEYSIVEFDEIIHPEIISLEIFYEEWKKVSELERKYIKEELTKNSNLLNISEGGEWGNEILNKLKKKNFSEKFNSYSSYKEYKRKKDITIKWLKNWIFSKSKNRTKRWLYNWVCNRSKNKTKKWIQNWVAHRKQCKTKTWIYSWTYVKTQNKTKKWVANWISSKKKKTKRWLFNWVYNKNRNKIKSWIQNWVVHRNENKIKRWAQSWIQHRKTIR